MLSSKSSPAKILRPSRPNAEAIAESCHPADQREQDLVDQIVAHGWRLKRLFKVEPQAWNRLFTILEDTPGISEDTRLAGANSSTCLG